MSKPNGIGLIGAGKRTIKPGNEFAQFYTKPDFNDKAEIKKGTVNDTCIKIGELTKRWAHQTEKISKALQINSTNRKQTAYQLWNYYHTYFQYSPDRAGVEELRSPRRSFWDRTTGVDCDCFSTSLSCNFFNIGATDAALKIIRRKGEPDFSHIYMVWPKIKGGVNWDDKATYYTIDPVVHTFDIEVDDIDEYKIYPMKNSNSSLNGIDIVTLDGLGNTANMQNDLNQIMAKGKAPNGYPFVAFAKALNIVIADPSQIEKAIELEQMWQKAGFTGPLYFTSGVDGFFKDAWNAGTTAVKNVVNTVVDKGTDAAKTAAHIAAGGVFVLAREGLKQVIKYNVFGLASLLAYLAKTNYSKYNETLDIWYKYGGDKATFTAFVNEGMSRVPRQVAPALLNRIPQVKGLVEKANSIYYGHLAGLNSLGVAVVDDVAIAATSEATVLTSLPIILEIVAAIGALIAVIKPMVDTKSPSGNDPNAQPPVGTQPPVDDTPQKTNYTIPIVLAAVAGKLLFF